MEESGEVLAVELRKLRKKLRQIDNLERADRQLTEQELEKVYKKYSIRGKLQQILGELSDNSSSISLDPRAPNLDMWTQDSLTQHQGDNKEMSVCNNQEKCTNDSNSAKQNEEECNMELEDQRLHVLVVDDNEEHTDENKSVESPLDTREIEQESATANNSQEINAKRKAHKNSENETEEIPSTPKRLKQKKTRNGNKNIKEKAATALDKEWRTSRFDVISLVGHNDIVCTLDVTDKYLLTGSRDTMVKLWNTNLGIEERSMGSHTDSVTAVLFLSTDYSKSVAKSYDMESDWLAVSGGIDCSIKLWDLHTGKLIKSIYTYNPVTCLAILDKFLISGSDGGKLELWDLEAGEKIDSIRAHDDSITCLQAHGEYVYTSSESGMLQVYQVRDKTLHLVFVSENVCDRDGHNLLTGRPIKSLVISGADIVYIGDNGTNIKAINWKNGTGKRVRNHLAEFGHTGSLCSFQDLLISSGYNLDEGTSFINVRSQFDEHYLGTVNDNEPGHIICMACYSANGLLKVYTGGTSLKIWHKLPQNSKVGGLPVVYYQSLSDNAPQQSDISTDELSDSDFENTTSKSSKKQLQASTSWLSTCSLL